MKKLLLVVLMSVFFVGGIAHAATNNATPSAKTQIQLAGCPPSCNNKCSIICTKNDDCGSGHKCVTATDLCSSSCTAEAVS